MSEDAVTWVAPGGGLLVSRDREEFEMDLLTGRSVVRCVRYGPNGREVISERVTRKGRR